MRTDLFDFALPQDLIAQRPAVPRDSARMLHVSSDGFADRTVRDLPDLLRPGDLMVVNDTKVIPAQLTARRGAARIGITLDRPDPSGNWNVLARNARRLRSGDDLTFDGEADLRATVLRGNDDGSVMLRFNLEGEAFQLALQRAGTLAIPPYIDRRTGTTAQDAIDYQTIFAVNEGAVAAPTAGLHFTPSLLDRLTARGIKQAKITLHVGAGTFLPVRVEDAAAHRMHAERGEISPIAAQTINATRAAGRRIVAVGTTSLRLLQTATGADGLTVPFSGETAIYIRPGVVVQSADLLLTNFHLPRSTLFMLVCAFAGTDRMKSAYSHAISERYRFFSYGDATLLERA